MEIAPREKACHVQHQLLYLFKCVHNDLINDLDLFHIHEAIFNVTAFTFDTNVVVIVSFNISSGFC